MFVDLQNTNFKRKIKTKKHFSCPVARKRIYFDIDEIRNILSAFRHKIRVEKIMITKCRPVRDGISGCSVISTHIASLRNVCLEAFGSKHFLHLIN